MPMTHGGSNIEVPSPEDPTSCGGYTGFNSLDLQQIYRMEKLPAFRSQIARGYGKPVVARMPDGEILATGFYSHLDDLDFTYPDGMPAHSGEWWTTEEAALIRSSNEGKTWSEPRHLGIPGRPAQFTCLADGTLIMAAGDALYRSTDRGMIWNRCEVAWEDFAASDQQLRGYGETNGVVELPDGTLFCSCYAHRSPMETVYDWNAYLIRSTDGGKTWGDATFMVHTDEISCILLPNGTLMGFARVDTMYARDIWGITDQTGEGGDTVTIIESEDQGRTWTEPRRIGLGMAQVPAFPLHMPDGRLLLIYGNRQFPFGSQVIASRDEGRTWDLDHPLILSWFSWDNYGGHPRSLIMPDGSILTGYYVRIFKESPKVAGDLVSHIVRWRVPDDWPREDW